MSTTAFELPWYALFTISSNSSIWHAGQGLDLNIDRGAVAAHHLLQFSSNLVGAPDCDPQPPTATTVTVTYTIDELPPHQPHPFRRRILLIASQIKKNASECIADEEIGSRKNKRARNARRF
mmetsp:Transcript_10933/g.36924  ORF Transcript_10933/g.36924 Transcript_10933/m.36924 type:complete len:122 (-) Transcript_10933:442-807(-)